MSSDDNLSSAHLAIKLALARVLALFRRVNTFKPSSKMLTSNPIRAIPLFSKGSASHITAHCSQSVNILRRPLVTLRVLCSQTHLIWKSCRIHPYFSPEFQRRFRGYFVVPLSRQASYLCFFFCLPAPENFFSDVAYFCLTSAHRCASSSTLPPLTLASSFTDANFAL